LRLYVKQFRNMSSEAMGMEEHRKQPTSPINLHKTSLVANPSSFNTKQTVDWVQVGRRKRHDGILQGHETEPEACECEKKKESNKCPGTDVHSNQRRLGRKCNTEKESSMKVLQRLENKE